MENSEMLHHLLDIFTYPTQIYDFFVKVIAKGVCFLVLVYLLTIQ